MHSPVEYFMAVFGSPPFLLFVNKLPQELSKLCLIFADEIEIAGIEILHGSEVVKR